MSGASRATLTRRDFGRALIAGAATIAAPALPAAREPVLDFAVAGGWFHGLRAALSELAVGERLRLVAEPENPYDRNAVAVWRGSVKLGYVPRAANAPLARLLAEGATVEAEIARFFGAAPKDRWPDDFEFTSVMAGDPVIRATKLV
ncbi:MAG: HIRAN domain-containing protein [Rhodoblastus sp.]